MGPVPRPLQPWDPGLCLPTHWPSLVLFSAQPARSGREWWLGASVDLAIEMISCCHCLSLIFTDDVWCVFVVGVLVIDAASFSKSNGASSHVAVHIDDLHLCLAKWLGEDWALELSATLIQACM